MKLQDIDFSPLDDSNLMDLDGRIIDPGVLVGRIVRLNMALLVVIVLVIMALISALPLVISAHAINALSVVFFTGLIAVSWFLIVILGKSKNKAWSAFAEANGWEITPPRYDSLIVPPYLIEVGAHIVTKSIITGSVNSMPFDLYIYDFMYNEGGLDENVWKSLIMVLPLGSVHTRLVILPGSIMRVSGFKGMERLSLEGNFNKSYKAYMEVGQQVDALSILTPEVMQLLLNQATLQGIEIYGDRLYIINYINETALAKNQSGDVKDIFEQSSQIWSQVSEQDRIFGKRELTPISTHAVPPAQIPAESSSTSVN